MRPPNVESGSGKDGCRNTGNRRWNGVEWKLSRIHYSRGQSMLARLLKQLPAFSRRPSSNWLLLFRHLIPWWWWWWWNISYLFIRWISLTLWHKKHCNGFTHFTLSFWLIFKIVSCLVLRYLIQSKHSTTTTITITKEMASPLISPSFLLSWLLSSEPALVYFVTYCVAFIIQISIKCGI